jgi:formate hydrogenlyase subunit 3/multisubunit Na+/H+ antiporter MnhD subunit
VRRSGTAASVTVGLLAATLQMVAHTIAKSLLFTSVAGIEAAGGSDDLEDLRRRARRTPWSCFDLLGANIRPVPVTRDDRRGTVVRHDGQPCPSACST